jgi:hypothetical protein
LQSEPYTTHVDEMRIYTQTPALHPYVPVHYATFMAQAEDGAGAPVDLNILICERAGPSLKWLLESGFSGSLEPGNGGVTPAVAVQINGFVESLWDLMVGLTSLRIDWYTDFHIGNVCQKRIGAGFVWVDIEKIKPVNQTFRQCVIHALRKLFMVSMMSNVPLAVRVYWNSLRGVLADASTDTSLPRLRECLQKHVPVPAVSRCLWCLM